MEPTQKKISIYLLISLLFAFLIRFITQEKSFFIWAVPSFFIVSIFHYVFFYQKEYPLGMVLFSAVLVRIVFIFQDPLFSDDIYRYFWDAELWLNGKNPYHYSPENTNFSNIAINYQYFSLINHKNLATLYPPLVEIYFVGIYFIWDSIVFLKFSYLLAEAFFVFLIIRFSLFKKDFLVFLLLHPLLWIEVYQSGHFDLFFLYFFILFIGFYQNGKQGIASIFNILSGQTRYFTNVIFLFLKKQRFASIISLIIIFSFNNYISQFPENGIHAYSESWSFNNPIFMVLHHVLMPLYNEINTYLSYSSFIKLLVYLLILPFFLKPCIKSQQEPLRFTFYFSAFFIFGSAVIYPWYCLIFIPLAYFLKQQTVLTFTYSIFFSYIILIKYFNESVWEETLLQIILVYLPVLLIYFFEKTEFKNKLYLIMKVRK